MSTHRPRRIDRRTAEQLLRDASSSRRPVEPDALSELLHAAARPAREGELTGEQAAVAAFHTARLHPDPAQHRRPSMIKTTLASVLTAKILIPTAAAAAVGGVTLAGATGTLTVPGDTTAGPPAQFTTSQVPSSTPASQPDLPAPALVGLCQAYTSGANNEHGKATDSPAFRQLAAEAGGPAHVTDFCADTLADRPGKPTDLPSTAPATPAHPTGAPEARPTGAPDGTPPTTTPAHPTDSPTATSEPPASTPDHPTGSPTATPTPSHPTGAPDARPGSR